MLCLWLVAGGNNFSPRSPQLPSIVVTGNESENKAKKQVKFLTEEPRAEPQTENQNKMKKKVGRTSSWSPDLAVRKERGKGKKKETEKTKKSKVPPLKPELNTKRRNSVPLENASVKPKLSLKAKVGLILLLITQQVYFRKNLPFFPSKLIKHQKRRIRMLGLRSPRPLP